LLPSGPGGVQDALSADPHVANSGFVRCIRPPVKAKDLHLWPLRAMKRVWRR
jgi:hypothetical protein